MTVCNLKIRKTSRKYKRSENTLPRKLRQYHRHVLQNSYSSIYARNVRNFMYKELNNKVWYRRPEPTTRSPSPEQDFCHHGTVLGHNLPYENTKETATSVPSGCGGTDQGGSETCDAEEGANNIWIWTGRIGNWTWQRSAREPYPVRLA